MKKVSNLSFSKKRELLDKAAAVAITSSQRIFFACSNPTWTLYLSFVVNYFCMYPCHAYAEFVLCS